ncbi:MAG: endonuclease/exonuclease/phosphatase family protein [Bacteroidia bacterium]|jgi:endonuclease/exonuclease/phosphatase family metal-dependent hydrolase
MIGKGIVNKVVFGLNMLAVIGLLLSFLALYISPETFWILAFAGLGFPFLFIANVLFVLYWIIIRWKNALFSGIPVLIGISQLGSTYQFEKPMSRESATMQKLSDSTLHIMSYNVRLFDLYNWTENKLTRNKIIDLIRKEQADILCFQEFYYDDTKSFNTLDTLLQVQPARFKHIEHTATVKDVHHWGIATLSAFPIVNKGIIPFRDSTDNISIFTDVAIKNDTIRIYNLHLESIRFRKKDYEALKILTGNEDQTNLDGPQLIISRMRRAFIRRARQTDAIRTHIKSCPYPFIVCGDFNDTPNSYSYHQIAQDLGDAYREAGSGLGTTYIGMIPFLRIDYILYTKEKFDALNFKLIKKKLSDHYPLTATFKLKKKKSRN